MRDIVWYVETAKQKNNIKSSNKLALQIGISGQSLSTLVRGHSKPCDETMLKLAELAGVEPVNALADLNMWRASSPKVLSVYQKMDKLLSRAAMLTVAFVVLSIGSNGANAAQLLTQNYIAQHKSEYILSHLIKHLFQKLKSPIYSFLRLLCFHNLDNFNRFAR